MSDNGKPEDGNIQRGDEGGDDEVRAWSSHNLLQVRSDCASAIRHFAASMALSPSGR